AYSFLSAFTSRSSSLQMNCTGRRSSEFTRFLPETVLYIAASRTPFSLRPASNWCRPRKNLRLQQEHPATAKRRETRFGPVSRFDPNQLRGGAGNHEIVTPNLLSTSRKEVNEPSQ